MSRTLTGSSNARVTELCLQGLWTNDTLHGLLSIWRNNNPSSLALADQPNRQNFTNTPPLRLTTEELNTASDNLAILLINKNVSAGDVILVQLPNIVELVVCYYAASKIGAIISPIPVQYSHHELANIEKSVKPTLGISCSSFKNKNLTAQMAQAVTAEIISFGNNNNDIQLDLSVKQNCNHSIIERQHSIDGNTVITLCWTSGTTGSPKGVPRTHNMWVATSKIIIESAELISGDTLLNPFPLVNMAAIGGFLYPCAQLGLGLALHHPIDIPVFLAQLAAEKINFSIIPPVLLNQLAKNTDLWNQFDFSALRYIGSGSAPLSPWMIKTFKQEYGKEIINFYGSNEGISLINTPTASDDPDIRATMFPRFGTKNTHWKGICHQLVRSKVVDIDTGNEITQAGKPGELMFAGATIFDGYLDHDNTIDGTTIFDSTGFFHTGDLVEICIDAENFYRIVGRCKDIINRGGMKISPAEIDILLEGFSNVAEAAICAVSDDVMGESICACLVPFVDAEVPTIKSLTDYLLSQGLAKYKLPEKIYILKKLPRNPMGKIMRAELEKIVNS